MSRIFIIIPCYNEEGNIKDLLEEIKTLSQTSSNHIFETIIVNDCSTDQTATEASNFENTVVLNLPINLGIGGAVQTGIIYACNNNADYAVKVDGDGQHNPSEIMNLIKPLIQNEADISIGSRFITENNGFKSTFFRRLGIKILQFVCRILTGLKFTDPTSGYRAYNKKALEFMYENYPGFDYPEPEEIVLSTKKGLKIIEVPVKMRERKKGKSSISFYGSIYYMMKVILAMFVTSIRKQ